MVWSCLEPRYRRRGPAQKRLRWGIALPDGSCLIDPQHADLLEAARRFVWSMAVDPPNGRRRSCQSTLLIKASPTPRPDPVDDRRKVYNLPLAGSSTVERFQAFLQYRRDPRPGKTSPTTVAAHLLILRDL